MEEIRALEESLSQPGHLPSQVSIADQQMEEAGGKEQEKGSEQQPQQQQPQQQGNEGSQPENMAVGYCHAHANYQEDLATSSGKRMSTKPDLPARQLG
eukprot:1157229-Pelagomonas_calceolata.AAC.7